MRMETSHHRLFLYTTNNMNNNMIPKIELSKDCCGKTMRKTNMMNIHCPCDDGESEKCICQHRAGENFDNYYPPLK